MCVWVCCLFTQHTIMICCPICQKDLSQLSLDAREFHADTCAIQYFDVDSDFNQILPIKKTNKIEINESKQVKRETKVEKDASDIMCVEDAFIFIRQRADMLLRQSKLSTHVNQRPVMSTNTLFYWTLASEKLSCDRVYYSTFMWKRQSK
jgi:hypothetical protein